MNPLNTKFSRWLFVTAVCFASALHTQAQQYGWTNFAGDPGVSGTANGTGSAAQFDYPNGVAVDGSGNVYVSDGNNETIREITPGGVVTTLAGTPGSSGTANGTGSAAQFDYPTGVAVDGSGNVYVADGDNKTIREIAPGGVVTTLAGSPGVTGTADGTGSAATFVYPGAVAVDGSGNVYVADTDGETIRQIAPGGVVTTLAGTPRVNGTANGTGGAAQFNYPNGVAVDGSGNVYVCDANNDTIREIAPGGVVTTLAGAPGVSGTADGTGSAARFSQPDGVAVDGGGNVYVADCYNQTIRKIAPGGVVTTIGGAPYQNAYQPGIGSAARFSFPGGIAVSGTGLLYVDDLSSNCIALGTLVPPFTVPPILDSPAANSTLIAPIRVLFNLPEPALPGSVLLTFDNGSGTPLVLTLSSLEEASGLYTSNELTFDPANPTASSGVAGISGGASIPLGTYTVTLSYQDAEGDPAASVSAASVTVSPVATETSNPINSSSATLAGQQSSDYLPSDFSNTYFEWGADTTYGNTIPAVLSSTSSSLINTNFIIISGPFPISFGDFQAEVTGLARDTTYHYQFVATLDGTTYYGGDQTFTTTHDDPPTTTPYYCYEPTKPAQPVMLDVLANDTPGNPFDTLTITGFSNPAGGQVQITGTGSSAALLYTADSRYSGNDSFIYTVTSDFGDSATGVVYIVNPYLPYAGNFHGLISSGSPGYLDVTLGRHGVFTGVLRTLGGSYSFTGSLNAAGNAAVTIPRGAHLPSLALDLSLAFNNGGAFTFTLNDPGNFSESGTFTPKILYSNANPAPETGNYTIIIPPPVFVAIPESAGGSGNSAPGTLVTYPGVPQGTGWATMTVSALGAVNISGKLGDGTAFTSGAWLDDSYSAGNSTYVGSTQTFAVYANVYSSPAGYIVGTMTFEDEPEVSDFDGTLSWYKPAQTTPQIYNAGFDYSVTMLGSVYVEPANDYVLDLRNIRGNALLTLSGGDLANPLQNVVTIAPAPRRAVVVVSGSSDSLHVTSEPFTGSFEGKFLPSRAGTRTMFDGVFFQKQNLGAGVITGTSQSGSVNITPQ